MDAADQLVVPGTLRDLRRVVSKKVGCVNPGSGLDEQTSLIQSGDDRFLFMGVDALKRVRYATLPQELVEQLSVSYDGWVRTDLLLKAIDRLISKYGPNHPLPVAKIDPDPSSHEKREKGTDEVIEEADPSANIVHGGDGASQETDGESSGGDQSSGDGGGGDEGEQSSQDDDCSQDGSGVDGKAENILDKEAAIRAARGLAKSPAIRRTADLLARLSDAVRTTDSFSERLDPRKLVTQLVTKEYRFSRCRRRERGSRLLVAVDCSLSCADWSYTVATSVLAAMTLRQGIVLVLHSNGEPDTVYWCKGGAFRRKSVGPDDWMEVIRQMEVTDILWFGDKDGRRYRRGLAEEGVSIMMLNTLISGRVQELRDRRKEPWTARHISCVEDIRTVIEGLKLLLRGRS